MTNEEQLELIAQARKLCEKRVGEYQATLQGYQDKSGAGYEWTLTQLNSWTTHLAEMDEHEGVHTDYGYVCQKCSKSFSQNGMTIRQYPCDFLVTKAKRLLGVE